MFDWAEHIIEIVNEMDTLALEDLVEFLSLGVRRFLIRGYGYSAGINHSRPNLEIHTSLHVGSVNYEVTRNGKGKTLGDRRHVRTDGGKSCGSGGRSLSSSS